MFHLSDLTRNLHDTKRELHHTVELERDAARLLSRAVADVFSAIKVLAGLRSTKERLVIRLTQQTQQRAMVYTPSANDPKRR